MNVSLERHTVISSNSVHIVVYLQKIHILVKFLLDAALMLCTVSKSILYFDVLMVAVRDFTTENNNLVVNCLIMS